MYKATASSRLEWAHSQVSCVRCCDQRCRAAGRREPSLPLGALRCSSGGADARASHVDCRAVRALLFLLHSLRRTQLGMMPAWFAGCPKGCPQ